MSGKSRVPTFPTLVLMRGSKRIREEENWLPRRDRRERRLRRMFRGSAMTYSERLQLESIGIARRLEHQRTGRWPADPQARKRARLERQAAAAT